MCKIQKPFLLPSDIDQYQRNIMKADCLNRKTRRHTITQHAISCARWNSLHWFFPRLCHYRIHNLIFWTRYIYISSMYQMSMLFGRRAKKTAFNKEIWHWLNICIRKSIKSWTIFNYHTYYNNIYNNYGNNNGYFVQWHYDVQSCVFAVVAL